MEKDRNYRQELKFEIPYGEYVAMQKRLRLIMKPDPHVGEYGAALFIVKNHSRIHYLL